MKRASITSWPPSTIQTQKNVQRKSESSYRINTYRALEFVLASHQMRTPKKEQLGGMQHRTVYETDWIVSRATQNP
jgi:hypothetical protein